MEAVAKAPKLHAHHLEELLEKAGCGAQVYRLQHPKLCNHSRAQRSAPKSRTRTHARTPTHTHTWDGTVNGRINDKKHPVRPDSVPLVAVEARRRWRVNTEHIERLVMSGARGGRRLIVKGPKRRHWQVARRQEVGQPCQSPPAAGLLARGAGEDQKGSLSATQFVGSNEQRQDLGRVRQPTVEESPDCNRRVAGDKKRDDLLRRAHDAASQQSAQAATEPACWHAHAHAPILWHHSASSSSDGIMLSEMLHSACAIRPHLPG